MKAVLIFTLLLATVHLQSIIIKNLGCKSYDAQQVCIQCSPRYYLDSSAICQPVNPNCKTYNPVNGACTSCYPGFGQVEDTCLPGINANNNFDPNCNTFNGDICTKCSVGYFTASNGKCQAVNPACKTYDPTNGACLTCYAGYSVQGVNCLISSSAPAVSNCNQIDLLSGLCLKCSFGYYFDNFGQCIQQDPNCKTFDTNNRVCVQCYPGNQLDQSNRCVKSQSPQGDPNCKIFKNDICVECAGGAIFNAQGVCIIINPACKTYDGATGQCTSCYAGFEVDAFGGCSKSQAQAGDPNCKTFQNGVCTECAGGAIFNAQGVCVIINPDCKTYDGATGQCTSCYAGFEVDAFGGCSKSQAQAGDPNCKTFQNGICTECAGGAIFNAQGVCIIVNPSCKTYDGATGQCTSCYSGFEVDSFGGCSKSQAPGGDPNCKSFQNNICTECSKGAIFNGQGVCIIIDPSCKTFNKDNGACTSCYVGFEVTSTGGCAKSVAQAGDPNCKTFQNGICTECSKGAIFNPFGICINVDPSCRTYDQADGLCTSCYAGFQVSSTRTCIKSLAPGGDPNCKTFQNDICTECAGGAIFNDQGICIIVNPDCQTYDGATGRCTSCYAGFDLNTFGGCSKAVAQAGDPNCKTFQNGVCTQCSRGSIFNGQKVCIIVDPTCLTYNDVDGACTSCYPGYSVSGRICILSTNTDAHDPNCKQFLTPEVCAVCSNRYFLNGFGRCQEVNPLCNEYNPLNGYCRTCYPGFALSGTICIQSKQQISDPNCAQFNNNFCVKCSFNFFFGLNGVCTAIDPLCNGHDPLTGACTGCYESYILVGPACILDLNNQLTDPNCAEFFEGICIRCATRTFINNQGKCQNVNVNCNTYNPLNGLCNSCYPGFQLQNGNCVQAISQSSCNQQNPDGSCARCGQGSYLSQGTCILIDPQCASFDINTQTCMACYDGYSILNGACQISKVDAQFQVQSCFAYDQQNLCIKCYNRYYLSNNVCNQVNVFCKTYDDLSGACLTCYTTFTLNNGRCIN